MSDAPTRFRRRRRVALPNWPRINTAPSKTKIPNNATLPSGGVPAEVATKETVVANLFDPQPAVIVT